MLRFVIIGVAAGLVIGVMTAAGQSVLSGNLFQLTNSGAIWVIITFVMGRYAASRTTAIVAGTLALFGELLGYYITVWLISPYVSPLWRILAWCAVAVLSGPLLAWGGYVSRHMSGRVRLVGLAMLGAIFIGEGLYLIAWYTTPVIPILWFVIGVGATALLTRREIQRARVGVYRWPEHLLLRGNRDADAPQYTTQGTHPRVMSESLGLSVLIAHMTDTLKKGCQEQELSPPWIHWIH